MDIPRTESSSYFFHPHKSSSPIEIPGRQQHDPEPSSSPRDRPTSPELIFEMEPFSPLDLPSTTPYSCGPSAPCTLDEREPLLYPFPRFSTTHFNPDRRRTHPAPQSTPGSSSSPQPRHPARPTKSHRRSQTLQLKSPPQTPTALDPAHAIRAVPIHKITGFKLDSAAQAPEPRHRHGPSIKKTPREKPLAPPPRSASFSSSPWRLPGRGEASDDEPRSLEIDFTQYLLRRIESQKPLQFQAFQAMMSVSVR
ncbi:hypothetical protein B0H17DRAFT_1131324 [Mycena rosella]|uniref:Uncharacterized protein n=1 Tax=Mycena rosella TaxID=1033263 RepID=A0AAD7GKW0_MYCRO|nr:hypothetical protein B0H17DRAFT_1131324 [Mycena rosella]